MNTKQLKEEIQKIIDELNSINEKLDEEPAEGEEKDPEEERMYIAQLEKRSKELILRKKELEEKLKIDERSNIWSREKSNTSTGEEHGEYRS